MMAVFERPNGMTTTRRLLLLPMPFHSQNREMNQDGVSSTTDVLESFGQFGT
jgi:hypothetical protein